MRVAALTAALMCSLPAAAQAPMAMAPAQDCAAASVPLPPELAGWQRRTPLAAAAGTPPSMLSPGRAVDAHLLDTAAVRYPAQPARPGESGSHGGLLGFRIETAGIYRIALGAGAWIDVAAGGRTVPSIAHGHGPDCSGIRKMVDFRLDRGNYVLQISGNGAEILPVMIVPRP